MAVIKNYARGNQEMLPTSPQPFYANSVGIKKLEKGEVDSAPGFNNLFIELVWGISGTGEISYLGQPFSITPNDVFYFLPGEEHKMRAVSAEWESRWLCFDGPLAVANFMTYQFPRLQHSLLDCPTGLFNEIGNNINSDDPFVQSHLSAVVIDILSYLVGVNTTFYPYASISIKCTEYIKKNYADPELGIDSLSKTFSVPCSTLISVFKKDVNQSIGQYIRNIRLGNACNLLRGTDLQIKEIALQCGYLDLNSFSRMFRKNTGMTPSEIRSKAQNI